MAKPALMGLSQHRLAQPHGGDPPVGARPSSSPVFGATQQAGPTVPDPGRPAFYIDVSLGTFGPVERWSIGWAMTPKGGSAAETRKDS